MLFPKKNPALTRGAGRIGTGFQLYFKFTGNAPRHEYRQSLRLIQR